MWRARHSRRVMTERPPTHAWPGRYDPRLAGRSGQSDAPSRSHRTAERRLHLRQPWLRSATRATRECSCTTRGVASALAVAFAVTRFERGGGVVGGVAGGPVLQVLVQVR